MMSITYGITEERYSLGNMIRLSCGVASYADTDENGMDAIVASVHDITSDRQALIKLVSLCNSLELSTIHLMNAVEDFLAS